MNGTYTQRRTTQRQNYGLGDLVRKIIPKEIAKVARVAAPFVAAVNPALAVPAAIAGGLGAYQQTGKLGRSLGEAGLTYGAGLASPGIGAWGKAGAASANLPGRAMAQKFLYGAPESIQRSMAGEQLRAHTTAATKGLLGAGGEFALGKAWGKGMPGIFAVGTAGALALDKMVGPKKPGETMGGYMARRKKAMEEYLRYYYKNVNPLASEEEVANFVATNTREYSSQGGRIGYALGGFDAGAPSITYGGLPTIPGTPKMAPDGLEYDMSQNGGFQPLGAQEGKDDIKANLAKNEFVFTADAVRGAGDGDIETGAQRMYDTMKRLEGRVA